MLCQDVFAAPFSLISCCSCLADGTEYGFIPASGDKTLCEDKCSADPSCSAFVWREDDGGCFWKSGVEDSTVYYFEGHICYRKPTGAFSSQNGDLMCVLLCAVSVPFQESCLDSWPSPVLTAVLFSAGFLWYGNEEYERTASSGPLVSSSTIQNDGRTYDVKIVHSTAGNGSSHMYIDGVQLPMALCVHASLMRVHFGGVLEAYGSAPNATGSRSSATLGDAEGWGVYPFGYIHDFSVDELPLNPGSCTCYCYSVPQAVLGIPLCCPFSRHPIHCTDHRNL